MNRDKRLSDHGNFCSIAAAYWPVPSVSYIDGVAVTKWTSAVPAQSFDHPQTICAKPFVIADMLHLFTSPLCSAANISRSTDSTQGPGFRVHRDKAQPQSVKTLC